MQFELKWKFSFNLQSAATVALGMAVRGFLASSPEVAITSKPTKAKKQVAAPDIMPWKPKGAKLSQFFGLAKTKPAMVAKSITERLRIVNTQFKADDCAAPQIMTIVKTIMNVNANRSGYSPNHRSLKEPRWLIKKFLTQSSQRELKKSLHALATAAAPMIYSSSIFQPITKAQSSPIVT